MKRPVTARALCAVVLIFWGSLGALALASMAQELSESTALVKFLWTVEVVTSAASITAGVGTLVLKKWARLLAIGSLGVAAVVVVMEVLMSESKTLSVTEWLHLGCNGLLVWYFLRPSVKAQFAQGRQKVQLSEGTKPKTLKGLVALSICFIVVGLGVWGDVAHILHGKPVTALSLFIFIRDAVLLVAGIGLLLLKNWARRAAISALGTTIPIWLWLLPMPGVVGGNAVGHNHGITMDSTELLGICRHHIHLHTPSLLEAVVVSVVILGLPIMYLTRPHVRAKFQNGQRKTAVGVTE